MLLSVIDMIQFGLCYFSATGATGINCVPLHTIWNSYLCNNL